MVQTALVHGGDTSRRRFLQGVGLSSLAVGAAACTSGLSRGLAPRADSLAAATILPFDAAHQAGIATPAQTHTHVAAFHVSTRGRPAFRRLVDDWTAAARVLARGAEIADDNGEAVGLGAARLTVTFGLGPAVFGRRLALGLRRPPGLLDLPPFPTDRLEERWSGGDVLVQACADDPQVAFHALRTLQHVAGDRARVHWVQDGFLSRPAGGTTPRNLMGFRDGTANIRPDDRAALDRHVWVGAEGPSWLRGGSYLVVRRIRIDLTHWDRSELSEQQHAIGRRKADGAPLGERAEDDPLQLTARTTAGTLAIPRHSHVRLAAPQENDGARLLRRGYNYTSATAAGQFDAGLLFLAYQRDIARQFVPIQRRLAASDALNEYISHVGSAVFVVPPGTRAGEPWARALLDG